MNKPETRTALLLIGTPMIYLGNYMVGIWLSLIGFALVLVGCYIWATLKHRHRAWALMGILAPIGFAALAALKDKTPAIETGR